MALFWICLCGICGICLILSLMKIRLLRKAAKEITEQFSEQLHADSNVLLSVSTGDKAMCQLASTLNAQLSALRQERLRCQQGDQALKNAVTNISHDLRTPLTAICGYLDLLQQEKMSQSAQNYLAIINERTQVIRQMTEEMLQYSVAISESPDVVQEDVILNHALEMTFSNFYAAICKANLHPEIQICEEPVHRLLNAASLQRIFSNILQNAIRYSDGDLKVTLTEDGRITFSNHAAKLDTIQVENLFERFYTVETAEKSTGLGLSIAKHLTEQMGGQIQADYRQQILTMTLYFPPNSYLLFTKEI
ncbi:MAG: sensor histidine kinase [Ruminococcus sp.]